MSDSTEVDSDAVPAVPARPSDPGTSSLRADAERNRRRIVEAAATVFAERGLDAALEDVADLAGVGIATLYRRYPTREGLVAACFRDRLAAYAAAAEEALAASVAWAGFCGYIERVCGLQAADRGTQEILTMTFTAAPEVESLRARTYERIAELVRRAKEEGALRRDFSMEDLVLLLFANAGVLKGMREAAPGAWQRFVALMIDAFRAEGAHPLPPAPTPAQAYRAMQRTHRPDRLRRPAEGG